MTMFLRLLAAEAKLFTPLGQSQRANEQLRSPVLDERNGPRS